MKPSHTRVLPALRFPPRTVKYRMILSFSVLITAALALVQAVNYYQSYATVQESISNTVEQSLGMALAGIDFRLQDMDNLAVGIMADSYVQEALQQKLDPSSFETDVIVRRLAEVIRKYTTTRLSVQKVGLINEDRLILDPALINAAIPSVLERLDTLSEPGAPSFTAIYRAEYSNTGLEVVSLVKNIYAIHDPGRRLGSLVADLDADVIKKTINEFALPTPGILLLVDRDGNMIYENRQLQRPGIDFAMLAAEQGINQGSRILTVGGEKYMCIATGSDYTRWRLMALVPFDALMHQATVQRNMALLLVVVCIAVAIAVSGLIVGQVSGPIRLLLASMGRVEAGDLTTRVEYSGGDELQQLVDGYNKMVRDIGGLIAEVKAEERGKRDAELYALQAQINPHFLYNSLNSIRYFARKEGEDHIRTITTALINLSRASLDSEKFITIGQEMQLVEDYLAIQRIRYGDIFTYQCQLEPELAGCLAPRFSIQPMVENALFHGVLPAEGGGIRVDIRREDGLVRVQVEDDGVGIPPDKLEELRGHLERGLTYSDPRDESRKLKNIGLYNIQHRIRRYFSDEYGIEVHSDAGRTQVTMRIPERRQEG